MARTFVIGDIHGAYPALKQCLDLSEFDYYSDRLICLGDVCDGWPQVKESVEELLKIRNLIYIMGNHDDWALKWFETGIIIEAWKLQGGESTINSYEGNIPESHVHLLQNARDYYLENNILFVHGGIEPGIPIEKQNREIFLWTRSLVKQAVYLTSRDECVEFGSYTEIYVGHTPTLNFNSLVPLKFCNVWLMDTGAGWNGGCLSMMEISTEKLFRSKPVDEFFPDFKGRNKLF
jgi:serine/threonine protein phosphatase 1